MEDLDTFGAYVRARRTSKALTQASLADLCGVQQSEISRIEKDQRSVSVGTLELLIASLGLNQKRAVRLAANLHRELSSSPTT